MKKKLIISTLLILAVLAVVALKNSKKPEPAAPQAAAEQAARPRLLDLGAGKCVPCKMMEPILNELTETYAGKLTVEFIDVWENQQAGQQYGIRVIPTQIFYDAEDNELFRHEGFYSKEDILQKWQELGVIL